MTTEFRSTPIGAISISTTSCSCSVKSSGGTIPVPVSNTAPWGNDCDRHRYPASSSKLRLMLPRRVSPANTRCAAARDRAAHRPLSRVGFRHAEADPGTERARAVVDLGLRQIQEVLAFDVARAHVVADRAADDRPRELITSASSGSGTLHFASRRMPTAFSGRHDLLRKRLEENLGPVRVVHPVVGRRAEVGLFHARGLAAQVRHASRPHFLALDRRAKNDVGDASAPAAPCDRSRSAAPPDRRSPAPATTS